MTAPAIYLQEGASKRLKQMFDCTSNGKVAEIIGVDQGQYSRVASGRYRAGIGFTARLLYATKGRAKFEDLFEVVDDEAASDLRRAS